MVELQEHLHKASSFAGLNFLVVLVVVFYLDLASSGRILQTHSKTSITTHYLNFFFS